MTRCRFQAWKQTREYRGGAILALGIAWFVCNIHFLPRILTWILSKQDMPKMDQGIMAPEGRSLTQIEITIEMVMTCPYF